MGTESRKYGDWQLFDSEMVDGSLRPFAKLSAATRTGVISKSPNDNAELLRFILGLFIIQRKGSGRIALTG